MSSKAPARFVLIRHGEAANSSPDGSDFSRPLTSAGQNTVKRLGQALDDDGIVAEVLFTSPARRTAETAAVIGDKLSFSGIIQPKRELYNCHERVVLALIEKYKMPDLTVFIVGHNPSMSRVPGRLLADFNSSLSPGSAVVIDFPTESDHLPQLFKHY